MKKLISITLLIIASSITNVKVLVPFATITFIAIYQMFKRDLKPYISYIKEKIIDFLFE